MPLDRSKWKAAPLSTVSETVQQTKQYDTYFGGKGEYAQFWKQRDGITVKRVLPAHEPGDSPYVPMLTAMLKCEVDEKDKEGKVIDANTLRPSNPVMGKLLEFILNRSE